ncbi:DUF5683 domain-containing protein [Flavobacterium qiangtangense]|uniref:DUF5683 domain-containing protein n=1 Tax=Flavobacterium qiangtangense TaxID=1442595 RepID=A0ABW1PM53_9FLAO
MNKLFAIVFFLFLSANTSVFAQEEVTIVVQDSLNVEDIDPLSPSKAAFYSAILPGLGQAYNKSYWKIPLVYGAIGGGVGIYAWNNKNYHRYRDEFKRRLAGTDDPTGKYAYLTDAQLISAQKQYQKQRDLSLIITVGLYILNIVEANVDAHLKQFNVNDNLTLRPDIYQNDLNNKQNLGLTLSYKF